MRTSETENAPVRSGLSIPEFQTTNGHELTQIPQELLQIALTSADTLLYQWDIDQGTISFSDNMTQVFPLDTNTPETLQSWLDIVHEDDRQPLLQELERWQNEPNHTSNHRYRLKHGSKTTWIRQSGVAINDGNRIVGIIYFNCTPPSQDLRGIRVSSVKLPVNQHSERTEYLYPELLVEQLQHAIDEAVFQNKEGLLLLLSIQNFGMIINAYGHQSSESVSQEIASEIKALLSADDSLFRIQRDQFAIIIHECERHEIENYISRICHSIEDYGYRSSIGDLHAVCAIGSSLFPSEGKLEDATAVIDRAYTALNRSGGVIPHPYAEQPGEKKLARQQMGLANYLRKALHENKLRLAFQPIIRSSNGEVAYYEALLRMIGEDGRISSAGPLIPVAEKMGLIDMVDHLVLDMVFQELDQAPQARLAMNVSNLTTENPNWLRHFQGLLRNRPDIAARLIVEITETAAHRDMRRTAYFVASMQELGCTVALDDFGSGYTSFRQLKALSVDMVKIDGSFVKDMMQNSDNLFFVKTLLEFTRCFGLESVAEFVENGETAKALMELGVDYQQGYYFGKPENFRGWLTPNQE